MCHVWDCQLEQWQNLPLLIFFNALNSRFIVCCCTSNLTALLSFFDLAKTLINEEDEVLCRRSYGLFKLVIDVGGHSSLWAVPRLYKCPELCKNQVDQAMGSKSVNSISLCWFSPPGSCLDFLPDFSQWWTMAGIDTPLNPSFSYLLFVMGCITMERKSGQCPCS